MWGLPSRNRALPIMPRRLSVLRAAAYASGAHCCPAAHPPRARLRGPGCRDDAEPDACYCGVGGGGGGGGGVRGWEATRAGMPLSSQRESLRVAVTWRLRGGYMAVTWRCACVRAVRRGQRGRGLTSARLRAACVGCSPHGGYMAVTWRLTSARLREACVGCSPPAPARRARAGAPCRTCVAVTWRLRGGYVAVTCRARAGAPGRTTSSSADARAWPRRPRRECPAASASRTTPP